MEKYLRALKLRDVIQFMFLINSSIDNTYANKGNHSISIWELTHITRVMDLRCFKKPGPGVV